MKSFLFDQEQSRPDAHVQLEDLREAFTPLLLWPLLQGIHLSSYLLFSQEERAGSDAEARSIFGQESKEESGERG